MKVNQNYKTVNVNAEESNPNSVLNYFRNLIKLRKGDLTLVYGKYSLIDKENPDVYSYLRVGEDATYLVLLNFKSQTATVNLSNVSLGEATYILGNYSEKGNVISSLRPYESVIYKLK